MSFSLYITSVFILSIASSSYVIPMLIIGGPLTAGFIIFNLNYIRSNKGEFMNLFDGFKRFTDYFLTFLLQIGLIFVWSLLFIVPGIIKALAYSQAIYIMYDNPGIGPKDALDLRENNTAVTDFIDKDGYKLLNIIFNKKNIDFNTVK